MACRRYLFPAGVARDGGLVLQRSAEPGSETASAADATCSMPSEAPSHGKEHSDGPSWEVQHEGTQQHLHSTHTVASCQHECDDPDGQVCCSEAVADDVSQERSV